MTVLQQVRQTLVAHNRFVKHQASRAGANPVFKRRILERWDRIQRGIPTVTTPTGLKLPRLALPLTDKPSEIARYLYGEGLPGSFPFVNGIYALNGQETSARDRHAATTSADRPSGKRRTEEPTRLFAGLGLAEDTNQRFHTLTRYQDSARLSTAFDGPTLYGLDSDADSVFGKVGEGGVAIDTVEDMQRLYAGFALDQRGVSVSMTINGPAPIILAMYVAAARRRFGTQAITRLRGTVQADCLKEVQAQNEMIFPLDASLRLLTDMVEYSIDHMPRWYPISISGYHMAEAGATPVQQAAYTLSNGLTYVELFRERGLDVNRFGPRLSFFLDCGLDIEYLALARVCRKIWAVAMRDVFKAERRAQLFRLHTQTSGRSLIAKVFKNNLTRTSVELMLAYINATNSCHSNSADEPFTTPSEEYVRLAANAQAIVLEESGLFKYIGNVFAGSPGMQVLEQAVEEAIMQEFDRLDNLGGVLAATEQRYQRSRIQASAHRYENQIYDNTRPVIGLNRYADDNDNDQEVDVVRTPVEKKQLQCDRLREFKRDNREAATRALDSLTAVVEQGGNSFVELLKTVEVCSLGQITERLTEVVGRFRPSL